MRSSNRIVRAAVVIVTSAALWSCDGPLSPEALSGTYTLSSVAGDPLPAVVSTSGDATFFVVSEQLEIDKDQATTFGEHERRLTDGSVHRYSAVSLYSVRANGDHLELSFICPINALCVPVPSRRAFPEPDGLRVEVVDGVGPLRYTRVPSPVLY